MNLTHLILSVLIEVTFSAACPLPAASDTRFYTDNDHGIVDATNDILLRRGDGNRGALFSLDENHEYWPVDENSGFNVVRYCFQDKDTKTAFEAKVKKAWETWADALGGGPGQSTHALFCFDDAEQKKWKKAVPFETLAILLNEEDEEFSHSTAGYWKGNYGQDWVDMDVYNWMRLEHSKQSSGYNTASIPTIAHEMGHTFGLDHEQIRPDRDNHIHLNCEAVVCYAEAKFWKDKQHPNLSMWDFCFSSNPQVVEWRDQIPDDEGFAMWADDHLISDHGRASTIGQYNVKSIMQYPSFDGAENVEECKRTRIEEHCVIMHWVDKAKGVKEYIPEPTKVTEKDANGLRDKYPYRPWGN